MESLERLEQHPPRKPLILMFIPLIVLIALAFALIHLYERELSQVSILTDISRVGVVKDVEMVLTDSKSGLRSVQVRLVQGDKDILVFEKEYPRQGMINTSGPGRAEEIVSLEPGKLKMQDGEAELVVDIRDYSWWSWMKGNLTTVSHPFQLDTKPPLLHILDSPQYIIQGGTGILTYSLNEEIGEHGVQINDDFHPGFPLPHKGEGVYGAIIGLQYDIERIEKSLVTAVDLAGNQATRSFGMIMRKRSIKRDRINVSDGFLDSKLPEFLSYYPDIPAGEPIDQYLEINNRVRRENNETIKGVCSKSRKERLWEGRFNRMDRSSRRAGFAEYRTYYYGGREVDKQVHLGIDLASTRKAEVKAANIGEVVYADYQGIYGEMVIIDHGLGVFSLYSHLSQINVDVGEKVDKQSVVGLSGTSGMAGGDHLHFSILVNGVFVDPLEWWDKQWLNLNILNFL